MKVLVTGGLGFIGSNLIEALLKEKHEIFCVDDMSGCREDAGEFIKLHEDKVTFIPACFAGDECLALIKEQGFDTVFHVAAIPRVSFSVENPYTTCDTNINKTVKLMEACIDNVGRFVFSSSSSVYGGADVLPTPTTYAKSPKSPYAWQKSCIEDLISVFCECYEGFDGVSLRYFNVFGPGQFGGSAYSTAISAWCHAVKNGKPLRKDGTGEQSRDMCYIDNVIDASLKAMKNKDSFHGKVFNVALGDRTTNNQILKYFSKKFSSKNLVIQNAPFRPGDVMHTQADISSTIKTLGYEPQVDIWKGLELTFKWWELE